MKVSIIIPNYNGEQLLKKNLPTVLSLFKDNEIIVVDDASTDGSLITVKNLKLKIKNDNEKLKILENKKNMGFASTVNRGVKEATGDLVLLLNTDVVPQNNFLDKLIPQFENNKKIFAIGCLQICEEDTLVERGRGIGGFSKGFLIHAKGEVTKDNTLWVSAGAGIFRKSVWESIGGLDPIYNPFYWEDIDLSYRAQKAGYELKFDKDAIVFHDQQAGSIKSGFQSGKIKTIAYRNQLLFVWMDITDLKLITQHLYYLPYHFIRAIIAGDHSYILGFFEALLLFPRAIIHRIRNKMMFENSDTEVFSKFDE